MLTGRIRQTNIKGWNLNILSKVQYNGPYRKSFDRLHIKITIYCLQTFFLTIKRRFLLLLVRFITSGLMRVSWAKDFYNVNLDYASYIPFY